MVLYEIKKCNEAILPLFLVLKLRAYFGVLFA